MPDRKELLEEFKSVFSGSNTLLDSALPPLLFLIINAIFGFQAAMISSLVMGAAITGLRIARGQKIWYALGGVGAAGLAIGLRYILNSTTAFFLPTLINGGLTTLILLVSILIKRPAVAFTSALTRRWPLEWYWHPKVRPAYAEVTAIWVVFSGIKLAIQALLYQRDRFILLAYFIFFSGWPALILLLAISYIYGLKRLDSLQGPSVEEFKNNELPPWKGQQRGF
ncbi:MAG: DUF3159 domain-containing protein [Chloroflexi bacterium]|nr:DUF3159 domain-containing protein [Chloroflexota bacterium]